MHAPLKRLLAVAAAAIRLGAYALAALAVLGFVLRYFEKPVRMLFVPDDDPAMNEAFARAKASLPFFWAVYDHRWHQETDFEVKQRFQDANGTEYLWLALEHRGAETLKLRVVSTPGTIKSVGKGAIVEAREDAIVDWSFARGKAMVGDYTIRVLFRQMTDGEVRQRRATLLDPCVVARDDYPLAPSPRCAD